MKLLTNGQLKMQNSVIFVTKNLEELVKNGEEITKVIPNGLQFIDSARFMASLLSNLVNKLAEGTHKINVKNDKQSETCGINCKNCDCLKYANFRIMKYLYCNDNSRNNFDKNFKKKFANTYKFSNHGIDKFILLRRIYLDLYEIMDYWEKVNVASLQEKEDFYSHLNIENITDADYTPSKKVLK